MNVDSKELLMSSNYWTLNKSVVKEFGIDTAFILTVLVEADRLLADEEGWFYQTAETLEAITGLTEYRQTKCIKLLQKKRIIERKTSGMPAKRYFRINANSVKSTVFKNFESKSLNNLETSFQKTSNNKERINKTSDINYMGIFEHYKSLGLVNHSKLTKEMKDSIDKAIKQLSVDEEEMKRMLDRFASKYNKSKYSEYPSKKRTLSEFFGQKKFQSTTLICSEYIDDVWTETETRKFIPIHELRKQAGQI